MGQDGSPENPSSPKSGVGGARKSPKGGTPKQTSPEPPPAGAAIVIPHDDAVLEPDALEDEAVFDDGSSVLSSGLSSTTSLRDEMILHVKEHGRQYQGYMGAKYVLPMDEQEIERLDFQCHLVWITMEKKTSNAPFRNLRRALDVGCGTAVWTIEFADEHPETEVLGVDIAPVQPEVVPPNLRFEVDDLEQPWNFTYKFDYIHCQLMTGAFQDWPKFIEQSFEYLETDGYFELHDIDFVIKCDDDTLPDDSPVAKWHRIMHEAAGKAGFRLDAISRVPDMMHDAGFVDIVARTVKWPMNTWPRDHRYKELGQWAVENFCWGCESMSLALFTRALGWSADEVRVFMTHVRQELRNRKVHAYWNFWIVYGRKPGGQAGTP